MPLVIQLLRKKDYDRLKRPRLDDYVLPLVADTTHDHEFSQSTDFEENFLEQLGDTEESGCGLFGLRGGYLTCGGTLGVLVGLLKL
jgi:hypothetical protein